MAGDIQHTHTHTREEQFCMNETTKKMKKTKAMAKERERERERVRQSCGSLMNELRVSWLRKGKKQSVSKKRAANSLA